MKTTLYNFKTKLGISASFMMLMSVGLKAQCPNVSVGASPTHICAGGNSQLQVDVDALSYDVLNIPFAPVETPDSGVVTLADGGIVKDTLDYHGNETTSDLDDAHWQDLPIPFNFNFFGITYNAFSVSTNGFVVLGSGEPITHNGYGNAFPSEDAAYPSIGAVYADLNFEYMGTINYFTTGTAPNRILVINYIGGQFYYDSGEEGPTASGSLTAQVLIYETTNVIEVHIENSTGDNDAVEGIQDATASNAYTVTDRNDEYWSVSKGSDAYRFAPPTSTYDWTPSELLDDATLATPMATGITGTTTFYVTVTTGECVAYDSVTVYQEELSGFTDISLSSVCSGTDVQLFASAEGGGEPYSYSWSGPNDFSSTDRNPIIDSALVAAGGTYTVLIQDGCTNTAEYDVSLTVNPLPVISFTAPSSPFCYGSAPITLIASPSDGRFSGPFGLVDGSTFYPDSIGMVPVMYTVTDIETGCTDSVTQNFDVVDCTGITENLFAQDVNMYPNPTTNMFTIDIQHANFSSLKISIIDPEGKEVYTVVDKNISADYKKQINLENLAKGIYFVKLSTDNGVKVKKLTLQ